MVSNVAVAGTAAGFAGAIIDPLLFNGTPLRGWSFWFVTETMNYIAILPVVFSCPTPNWRWIDRRREYTWRSTDFRKMMPLLSVLLSCVLSVLVGGPDAATFPVPALLWCSVTYSVFSMQY